MASKILTRDQAEARKAAAVRFAENVLNDADKASDIEDEDLDDWIERKGITLIDENRGRASGPMANSQTKEDLMNQIQNLQADNDFLQSQLDAIGDVLAGVDEDDDDDDCDDYNNGSD